MYQVVILIYVKGRSDECVTKQTISVPLLPGQAHQQAMVHIFIVSIRDSRRSMQHSWLSYYS